ncbi:hypothetical protein NTHI1209_01415 [Haemophilus influenzae]|uniref:Uncharacterized protein n=1 Tax=Haemophilus influenzae TaxID=727 RepID=A0A158SY59_HAEIF|nr:hypothetical protein NTHI1209_01415 [Haemophilus influenzae]
MISCVFYFNNKIATYHFPLAKFSIVLASINRDNNAPIQKAKNNDALYFIDYRHRIN